MAENSRKNEFFERESIAMMAITTNSSIRVNLCVFFVFHIYSLCFFIHYTRFLQKNNSIVKKNTKKEKYGSVRMSTDWYGGVILLSVPVRSCPLLSVALRKSGQ